LRQNRVPAIRVALAFGFLIAVAGCGRSTSEETTCEIPLSFQAKSAFATDPSYNSFTYQGSLSSACKAFVTEKSGAVTVKISVDTERSEGKLLKLTAGSNRSHGFDAQSGSLAKGGFDTSFSSTDEATWNLPWSDNPSAVNLQLLLPVTAADSIRPASISIKLFQNSN
jgi:hypothetical protein